MNTDELKKENDMLEKSDLTSPNTDMNVTGRHFKLNTIWMVDQA